MGPFRAVATVPESYQLQVPDSLLQVHSLFYTGFLKPEAMADKRVHMPLLDQPWHAHIAPNTGVPDNTYTIMHAV